MHSPCPPPPSVTNTGAAPITFEALLHTYLSVGAAAGCRVSGLAGLPYKDKPSGLAGVVDPSPDVVLTTSEVDRIYADTPALVTVRGVSGGPAAALTVQRAGWMVAPAGGAPTPVPLDVVVWNPGAIRAAAIADLGDEDYLRYVCVEPGRVSPATAPAGVLPPGGVWTIQQVLTAVSG